jgi:5-methylthioadenosine/S-adenosylhomocysteine deaminase
MSGPPIRDGALLLGADGRIQEVGAENQVSRPSEAEASRWPAAAILPGLVNTHTHLELTGFAGLAEEPDFPAWIRRIRALKAGRNPAEFLSAARAGLASCHAAGVTTVADTGDSGAVIEALHEAGGSGIAYHEVFGPHPEQLAGSLAAMQQRVTELRRFSSPRVRLGVSPHAPYTVSAGLYAAVARYAEQERLPMAVHLAESEAESALLDQAAGPFAEAWALRGIPLPPLPGRSPVAWLQAHGVLGERTLAIHVVQADPADVARLAQSRTAVAHCPGSNRRHGHGTAPIDAFLAAGLRVGVGTDSVASVGTLDLLGEARAARALGGLSAERALSLATRDAARALGMDGEVGALRPGLWGDVAVVAIPACGTPETVLEAVLAGGPADVQETMLGGRTVHRR